MAIDAEGNPVAMAKPTEPVCDRCGSPMAVWNGRRGPFLACTLHAPFFS
jgi:hypothetical protein